jgi:hypothetical protein
VEEDVEVVGENLTALMWKEVVETVTGETRGLYRYDGASMAVERHLRRADGPATQ